MKKHQSTRQLSKKQKTNTYQQKNKINVKLILLIGILLLIIVFNSLKKKSSFKNTFSYVNDKKSNGNSSEKNNKLKVKYRQCNYIKLQNTLDAVFTKYNFDRINEKNDNWDLYILCGYNYAETELNNIKITNPNQKVYAIKGCDKIASKNELWKIVRDYYGNEKASQLIPESFIINNPKDIKRFKNRFNKNNLYLLKKNIQRKKGILIINDYNEILKIVNQTKKDIKNYYNKDNELNNNVKEENYNKNQKINSLINNYKIIQLYIDDLYLINNRKCNLRIYVLIVCDKGNKKGYIYNKGKCIYTNKDYDNSKNKKEFDKEEHLTSYLLDQDIYKTHPESFDDLKIFLGKNKYDYLWKQINVLFKNIMTAIYSKICNDKKINKILSFQLFGADVIFTKNLHPYLLEFNKGPSMKYMNNKDKAMKIKLTEDIFKQVNVIPFEKGEQSNFNEIKI